jgi:exodeoxyribonuclease VII small subunit
MTSADGELTYEQLVERLELITQQMAAGDIGIEEAADLYEEAGRLHALAAERLARVQERIARLEDGSAPPPTP